MNRFATNISRGWAHIFGIDKTKVLKHAMSIRSGWIFITTNDEFGSIHCYLTKKFNTN